MVGEKDRHSGRDPRGGSDEPVDAADTSTWVAGTTPPRIEPDPVAARPSESPVSPDTVETLVAPLRPTEAIPERRPRRALEPLIIERIEPSLSRGQRIRLDASHRQVRVGRSRANEFRLYTGSTSREHAVIEGNAAGEWVLVPLPGRIVKVDGHATADPVVIEPGMSLIIGGDHLRCLADDLPPDGALASKSSRGFRGWRFDGARVGPRGGLAAGAMLLGVGLVILLLRCVG